MHRFRLGYSHHILQRRISQFNGPRFMRMSPDSPDLNPGIRLMDDDTLDKFFEGLSKVVGYGERQIIAGMAHHVIHIGSIRFKRHIIEFVRPAVVISLGLGLLAVGVLGLPALLLLLGARLAGSALLYSVQQAVRSAREGLGRSGDTSAGILGVDELPPLPPGAAAIVGDSLTVANLVVGAIGVVIILIGLLWLFGRIMIWRWAYISLSFEGGVEMVYQTWFRDRTRPDMTEIARLSQRSGFLVRHQHSASFDDINETNYKQSLVGRICHYGNDLVFDTPGSLANLSMDHVPYPRRLSYTIMLIKKLIEHDTVMDDFELTEFSHTQDGAIHGELQGLRADLARYFSGENKPPHLRPTATVSEVWSGVTHSHATDRTEDRT